MSIRNTKVFGERQFVKIIAGTVHQITVCKVLLEVQLLESRFRFTVRLVRKENLTTGSVKTTTTISGSSTL
jgi:fibronectin type 3 domain-containing protein